MTENGNGEKSTEQEDCGEKASGEETIRSLQMQDMRSGNDGEGASLCSGGDQESVYLRILRDYGSEPEACLQAEGG